MLVANPKCRVRSQTHLVWMRHISESHKLIQWLALQQAATWHGSKCALGTI
jgi:hypothetical protein